MITDINAITPEYMKYRIEQETEQYKQEIERLNKEKMNFNVVIRNEKPIQIDTQGLDYMVDLEQKYYILQDIIKEVREYVKIQQKIFKDYDIAMENQLKNILEIFDKENKE